MSIRKLALLALSLVFSFFCLFPEGQSEGRDFEYRNIDSVAIENAEIYKISVEGGDANTVAMRILQPDNPRYKVYHDVREGKLKIWVKDTHVLFSNDNGEHQIMLKVPRNTNLRLSSNTGAIEVWGMESEVSLDADVAEVVIRNCYGGLDVHSGVGSLTVNECKGDIRIRSDIGRIDVKDSDGHFTLQGGIGSIGLDNLIGRFDVRTEIGSIEAESLLLNGDSQFHSGTGRINLDVGNSRGDLMIIARSNTGEIDVFNTSTKKYLEWGSGSVRLELESETGSIDIR